MICPPLQNYSDDQIGNEMGGLYSTYGREDRCIQGLCGKPEGKRRLGRPRCRWEDNIKMNLQKVGCRGLDSIDLAQDRERSQALLNAVMSIRVL